MLGVGVAGPMGERMDAAVAGVERQRIVEDIAERDAWAILASVSGLGPVALGALVARYGTAARVLAEAARPGGPERLAATPAPDRAVRQRYFPVELAVARLLVEAVQDRDRILARIRGLGIEVLTIDDRRYPPRLAAVPFPPHVLFVQGSVAALARQPGVAVVGTRGATGYGRTTAARIARTLVAADMVVVSGLALGIDGAAHEAALRASGTTVAVIGGGHVALGPPSHRRLAEAIVAGDGAVVSELAPDLPPTKGTFPRRNRIISGLSEATVVVEAPARSGALITASWAIEQGRGCFVVPGPLDAPASEGCLALLREFPDLVRVVAGMPQLIADIRLVAGLEPPVAGGRGAVASPAAVGRAALAALGAAERSLVDGLLAGNRTVDELVAVTGAPVATVLAGLGMLERRGLAVGIHGRYRPSDILLDL